MTVKEKEHKDKLFENWQSRDKEWLMQRLWETRNQNTDLMKKRMVFIDHDIKEINDNLAKILTDNGIRPHSLIIEYIVHDCESCIYFDDGECNYEGYDDLCEYKNIVKTVSFYSFEIDNDYITGINSKFESEGFSVIKVIDSNTSTILYEKESEG